MKKWILTLISLGYISPIFATAHDSFLVTGETLNEIANYDHAFDIPNFFTRVFPQNLNPNLVIVPRTNSGFLFGLTGALLRPFDNQTDYVIPDTSPLPFVPSTNSVIREISPDYNFGYGGYLGYVYPYTGRDIKFEFFLFDNNVNDSITAPTDGTLWTPLALYDQTVEADAAFAKYTTNFYSAKLMMGQNIFAGTRFRIHPSFGLQYAGINRELKTNYGAASSFLDLPFGDSVVKQKSNFNGLGPAIQFDLSYFLAPHFALTGHLLNSILVGTITSEINYSEDLLLTSPLDSAAANTVVNLKSANRCVANLDGKLGVCFQYPFCGTNTKMDIEIGYEFNHFFNAIDTYRSAGGVFFVDATDPPVFVDTPLHIKNPNDLTIDGPYLTLGLSGISCPDNVVIDPVCVTVPKLDGGFVFSIGAIYYRMNHNHTDFAILDPSPTLITDPIVDPTVPPVFVPSTRSTLKNVESDSSYGLMFDLGYIFRKTPYDITFHFEGLNGQDKEIVTAPAAGVVWPILATPFFNSTQTGIFATRAHANLKNTYYEAHLDVGQAISADNLAWFRLFEGIEYARLYSDLHVTYDNVATTPFILFDEIPDPTLTYRRVDVVQKSRFNGYGPRFGIDMALPMGWINLIAEMAGGFLFGNIDTTYSDTYESGILTGSDPDVVLVPGGNLGASLDSQNQVVPFLDTKVAIGYGFDLFARTKWTVELGFKAAHYFNAATTFRHVTNNSADFVKQVDDITVNGPYLNVSVFGFGTCPPDCLPRDPFCVIVPELKGGLEAAIEYLYLRPNVVNVDYALVDPAPTFVPNLVDPPVFADGFEFNPSARSRLAFLTPQFASGYRVHLGYIFPLTSNDISVNFVQYEESSSDHAQAPAFGLLWTITNGSFGAVSNVDPSFFPIAADHATVHVDFDWQTGNVEMGKRVKFYNLMLRAFAGLSYAKVSENIKIAYLDGFADGTDVLIPIASDLIHQGNDFSGFGPRLGIAGDFGFGCGFSLIGLIGTDLLVGTFNSSLEEVSSSGDTATLNPTKRTRLAPAVDAKIGLAYTIALKNCAQISLEGGYQMNHYFNAKDSLRFTSNSNAFIKQEQDISFDGLYGRLQINF